MDDTFLILFVFVLRGRFRIYDLVVLFLKTIKFVVLLSQGSVFMRYALDPYSVIYCHFAFCNGKRLNRSLDNKM